jgi:hypothetical protein
MRSFELEQAGREDIEAFIADQLARWKPATATNRCRSLRVFYGWLEAEGEIPGWQAHRACSGIWVADRSDR